MTNNSRFINIYDTYCPMLYSIALQICKTNKRAEDLLSYTFVRLYEDPEKEQHYPAFCITLMQLVIKSGRELYPKKIKPGFRLKQFAGTPIINQLICEQISLHDYCNENCLTRQQAMDLIQQEFAVLKNLQSANNDLIPAPVMRERELV